MRRPLVLATAGVLAVLAGLATVPSTAAEPAVPAAGPVARVQTYEVQLDSHPSRDPHLVSASSNEVQAVWLRTLHGTWSIRAKRHAPNGHWGEARELDSFPAPRDRSADAAIHVVQGGPKQMVASWLHGKRVMLSIRPGGGDTWGPAEAVTGPRTRALTLSLYVNPRTGQEAISFLVRQAGGGSVVKVAVRREGAWFVRTVGRTGSCAQAAQSRSDVVVDDDGNVAVAYQDFRDCHDVRPTASRLAADATAWEEPHGFGRYGDLGTGSDPHLFVDPSGLVTLEVARTQFSRIGAQPWVEDQDAGAYGGDCVRCYPDVQRNDTGDMAYADATSVSVRPAGGAWRDVAVRGRVQGIQLREDGSITIVSTTARAGRSQPQQTTGSVDGTFADPVPIGKPAYRTTRSLADAPDLVDVTFNSLGSVLRGTAVWSQSPTEHGTRTVHVAVFAVE